MSKYTKFNSPEYRKRVNVDALFDSPCQFCTERTVGCHSNCKKYNSAKQSYEEKKKLIDEGRKKYASISFKKYGYR